LLGVIGWSDLEFSGAVAVNLAEGGGAAGGAPQPRATDGRWAGSEKVVASMSAEGKKETGSRRGRRCRGGEEGAGSEEMPRKEAS
jgi:hypothetical protein